MTRQPSRREILGGAAAIAGAASVAGTAGCHGPDPALRGRKVGSVCRICTTVCGIDVWVDDDRVVRVAGAQNSPTRGFACVNGLALPELQSSARRVTHPMIRRGGRLVTASWSEALGEIARRMKAVIAEHGARAIALQSGWALVYRNTVGWLKRLADAIGTPNFASSSSICVAASRMSNQLTFGRMAYGDFNRAALMVAWGWNPMHSSPPFANILLQRRAQGGRLVVIDPHRTRLAAQADWHLAPRPGTDLALALGLLGVMVREELYDRAFVDSDTIGFDQLQAAVEPCTPDWTARRTGLQPDQIEQLAREIAAAPSACGHTGVAVEQSPHGLETCRAVQALWAITGNINRPGGYRLMARLGTEAEVAARGLEPKPPPVTEPRIGAAEHPLFTELVDEAQGNLFPRAILEGKPYPLRALMVVGANPLLSSPDTGEVARAMAALDLLVVADPILTETAELAHVVLPVATFLETDEYVAMRNTGEVPAVVSPPGEAWPDWKIGFELARHLGHERFFPWPTGRAAREAQAAAMKPPPRRGYLTPSGKIELASERLRQAGLSAVPAPVDPAPVPDEFPLVLTTGARRPGLCNSQLRGIPMVENRVGPLAIEVAEKTAAELGLEAGQLARLETEHGSVSAPLAVLPELRPGVVRIAACAVEANANQLSSSTGGDPGTGFPNLRAIPCRLVSDPHGE